MSDITYCSIQFIRLGFLPRYTIEGRRHCHGATRSQFSKFMDAKMNCDQETNCIAIWDYGCKGNRFYTCQTNMNWKELSESDFSRTSCVFHQNPGKLHYTIDITLPFCIK